MKTKFRLLITTVFVVLAGTTLFAETDNVPDTLFISEFRADALATGIIELYNGDSDTIWLSNFDLVRKENAENTAKATLQFGEDQYILPGQCYTVFSNQDLTYAPGPVFSHIDTIHSVANGLRNGDCHVDLEYNNVAEGENNIIVDQILSTEGHIGVNGVANGSKTCLCIRKFTVKVGNPNFSTSADTEWFTMDLPNNGPWRDGIGFSTLYSNHADNSITTNPNADIVVNNAEATITVPYGIWRQDFFIEQLNPGLGMTWEYYIYGDTSSILSQTGDKIALYAYGNDMETIEYDIIVSAPTEDYAGLAPYGQLLYDEELDEWAYYFGNDEWPVMDGELASYRYNVTDFSDGTMDTVGNIIPKRVNPNYTAYEPRIIPFAERVDTLIKYLDIPANCTYDFTWIDGNERVDLKAGDILNITSKDGNNTRSYYLNVDEYDAENIASLSNVTWPDIPSGDAGMYYETLGWKGDSIPGFSSSLKAYNIDVVAMSTTPTVPALFFEMTSDKSTMTVDRAFDLTGSADKRTTTVTVTAEDGTTVSTYKFIFKIASVTADEPFIADPIITQHTYRYNHVNFALEISNPGNQPLDLSNYLIASQVNGTSTPENVITTARTQGYYASGHLGLYTKFIPGCKWDSTATYVNAGINRAIDDEGAVNTILPPGGSFLFMSTETRATTSGSWAKFPDEIMAHPYMIELPSIYSAEPNVWGEQGWAEGKTSGSGVSRMNKGSVMLFKILNEEVKTGAKDAMDAADFEIIDWLGTSNINGVWIFDAGSDKNPDGVKLGNNVANHGTTIIRKPNIYKGVTTGITTTSNPGFGSDTTDSEWEWYGNHLDETYDNYSTGVKGEILYENLGKHTFDAVTIYQSVIGAKESYLVSNGYGLGQTIKGVTEGTTATQFFAKIDTLDAGQTMTLYNAGTVTTDASYIMKDADSLVVVSADGVNSTTYSISVTADGLDANSDLKSTDETIIVDNTAKTITLDKLTEIATIYASVSTVSATSKLYVMQGTANVPTKVIGADSVYVNTAVAPNMSIDIMTQSGTTVSYEIIINAASSDAYVTSQVYTVTEDNKSITGMSTDISVANLLSNVFGAPNASLTIVDNMFFERTYGTVRLDDQVKVVSEDGSTTAYYHITMEGEAQPDASALNPVDEITAQYQVYPNPTNGIFYIDGTLSNAVVSIFSTNGTMINRTIKPSDNQIDLSGMQSGIYFVVISGIDGGQETHKLLKK